MPETLVFFRWIHSGDLPLALKEIEQLCEESNVFWQNKVAEFQSEALENIRGTIRYYKITEKNPLISLECPLVNRYFTVLKDSSQSKVVHNGWIRDARPDVDFATEINFNYLRRTINIWGDSIKLRYGRCPADSPFLWAHMSKYVT